MTAAADHDTSPGADDTGTATGTGLSRREAAEASGEVLLEQPMLPLSRFKPDPDNVRDGLDLNTTFVEDIAAFGIEVPLTVRLDPADPTAVIIVEGHRRYYAALQAGLAEAPYSLQPADQASKAGQKFLTMYRLNHPDLRKNHRLWEQVAAIQGAAASSLSRREIGKRTGLSGDDVDRALAAGRLSADTVAQAKAAPQDCGLRGIELLAQFTGDDDNDRRATQRLLATMARGSDLEHAAEILLQERRDRVLRAQAIAGLHEAGVQVIEEIPDGAVDLAELRDGEGTELTPQAHADCAGHRAFCGPYSTEPGYLCLDPVAFGHDFARPGVAALLRRRAELIADGITVTLSYTELPPGSCRLSALEHDGERLTPQTHRSCPGDIAVLSPYGASEGVHYCTAPDDHGHAQLQVPQAPARRPPEGPSAGTVARYNREWIAAGKVRRRWLAEQLLGRKKAPKQVTVFITQMMMSRPEPVAECLGSAKTEPLFADLTRKPRPRVLEGLAKLPTDRLALMQLAEIAAAFEHQIVQDTGERRNTWRTDRGNPHCPRSTAAQYLSFLVALGYQPSPIEKAIIAGVAYTGADPSDTLGQDDGDGIAGDGGQTGQAEASADPPHISESGRGAAPDAEAS
ncbi:ParB N-terminal domain-containing protein [Actinomadura graeca]|uniref:ParB N-terminal domain-containing protein n=1 Tax=Actinomadura graeca TaxID=2750812 RepID=A0ABX8R4E9_9ACTN|nr:ParB/RepB/Spo0J family partition protein [Actinomadura graeca]QXJ25956.1 ParB N-terminal domain-containing protein [Actinomadura graeca]